MSSYDQKVQAAIASVKGRSLPAKARTLALAGIAWGVIGLAYGFFAGEKSWTLGALLVSVFYFMCMGQGAMMFSVVLTGTLARWGRPLKRIAEMLAFTLPVTYIALVVFFVLGGLGVYEWAPHNLVTPDGHAIGLEPHAPGALAAKPFWLSSGFFIARQLIGFGILLVLDVMFIRSSLRPDLILAKQTLGNEAPAWWDRIIGGKTDVQAEAEATAYRGQWMTPVMGLSYAVFFSLLTFDLIMSMDAWWFSNMFGGWVFMSSLWLGMATIAFVITMGREWLGLGEWVSKATTHDLGKLMLAGTMFWGYTLYAQLLPIWYADVPEETNYLLVRMMLPEWSWLSKVVAITCFIAPFTILLSRGVKKMRWPFAAVAMLIMLGVFLERSLLVMPSAWRSEFLTLDFIIVNFGVWFGMGGLVTLWFGKYMSEVPAVPVADEYLKDDPWEVHVHSLDEAHGHH